MNAAFPGRVSTANYQVAADRRRVVAEWVCEWGTASEDTRRIGAPA
ncbi:hypothetical protein [Streptomyces sp. NPDC004266]